VISTLYAQSVSNQDSTRVKEADKENGEDKGIAGNRRRDSYL
jgi:hypothetical protein